MKQPIKEQMQQPVSPRTALIIVAVLVVVVGVSVFAWRLMFRPKKANIVFNQGSGSSAPMSARDRMLDQINRSARTVGGPSTPSAPPAPGSP